LPEASRDTIIKMKTLIEDGYCRSPPQKKAASAKGQKGQKLPYGMSLPEVKLLVCIVTASPVVYQ
jgi:hypothetical protein